MSGRPTFVIAHRLATVVDADQIVVLRNGNITEQGTHQELILKDGYYASLVQKQPEGLRIGGTGNRFLQRGPCSP